MVSFERTRAPQSRPRFELADIVREHGEQLRAQQALTPEQGKVLRAIAACRTAALGGHLDGCLDCGYERPAYNSCRNRHCPKCQALAQERWLAGRMKTLLPIPYFHVVFTLPGDLSSLVLRNRALLFGLLFQAASQTLVTLGRDPARLGAQLGITMVLHTWTRDQRFHPHVHAIVTGGGLSEDGRRWIEGDPNYLFPVKVLSKLFRGKMLDAIRRSHEKGELDLPPELRQKRLFKKRMDRLYKTNWVTYAKKPFAGPKQILEYLGRYTHRVAMSNHRLLELTKQSVTLRTRGQESVTLKPLELLRRFLLHVLPTGFVRIRHYGLHASSNLKTNLRTARTLLGVESDEQEATPSDLAEIEAAENQEAQKETGEKDWRELLRELKGIDATVCPVCASKAWIRIPLNSTSTRAPPRTENA